METELQSLLSTLLALPLAQRLEMIEQFLTDAKISANEPKPLQSVNCVFPSSPFEGETFAQPGIIYRSGE